MMMAIDSETTGLDLFHAAGPFYVTTFNDKGEWQNWCWDVDPLTRRVLVNKEDVEEIRLLIASADVLVGQNQNFDAKALARIGIADWPWERTVDTLIASHLLASNHRHNLTDMAMEYLDRDIEPLEKVLEEACKKCRSMVQQARLQVKRHRPAELETEDEPVLEEEEPQLEIVVAKKRKSAKTKKPKPVDEHGIASWRIAEEGLEEMPSCKGSGGNKKSDKDKAWKNDMWLPRAMVKHLWETGEAGTSWFNWSCDKSKVKALKLVDIARFLPSCCQTWVDSQRMISPPLPAPWMQS